MITRIILKLLKLFDKDNYVLYTRAMSEKESIDKNNLQLLQQGIFGNSINKNMISIKSFYESHGGEVTREVYLMINTYYTSILSEVVYTGDEQGIIKLKYLQDLILEIKDLIVN